MDLNDIVVFAKVAETKSFTGAAEALGLPKSTVSRKLALTDIGEAYYERCTRIVHDVLAAEQLVTDMQATPRGRLRVSSTIDFSTLYLGEIIADFLIQHPEINVELDASNRVVDLIEDGFDVAVRFGPMPESTLIARRLCSVSLVLCASPAYVARTGAPKTIEELDEHDHILFTPATLNQTWTVFNGEQSYEFGRPARFASNNYNAVKAMALASGGVALISDFMVGNDLASGLLVRVLPDWQTRPTEVHAVYPARQNLPPRLTLFLDHLAKSLNPPPWTRP